MTATLYIGVSVSLNSQPDVQRVTIDAVERSSILAAMFPIMSKNKSKCMHEKVTYDSFGIFCYLNGTVFSYVASGTIFYGPFFQNHSLDQGKQGKRQTKTLTHVLQLFVHFRYSCWPQGSNYRGRGLQ